MASDETADGDLVVQSDVLGFLLARHPAQMHVAEMEREMAAPAYGPHDIDAVKRAIRDLVQAGCLHQTSDGFIFPTHAAVHASTLPR